MKRALIVTNLIGFIGFLWNDIDVLEQLGYEVSYASNGEVIQGEHHQEELAKRGIKFYQLNFSSKNPFAKENFCAYKKIQDILKNERFDMIHCHTPIAGFITRMAAKHFRKRGMKVIYTTHGFSFTHLSSKKQWFAYYNFEKFVSRYTDVIITINREDYANAKTMHCKDVRLINGVGVNTEQYHNVGIDSAAYKYLLGIPKNKIVVLSVGELSARKNHQVIIKALSRLNNKNNYCYVICGREIAESGFADYLRELANKENVDLLLLGHRSDIAEINSCADIGVIPSVREGLGLAGIQLLSAGIPLVGTDVQGIKDYIIPGKTGCLCDPYDVDAYAKAILYLSDVGVREMMKENCYSVAKKFDTSVSHKQMFDIYTELFSEK